jgi:hypothetical protein
VRGELNGGQGDRDAGHKQRQRCYQGLQSVLAKLPVPPEREYRQGNKECTEGGQQFPGRIAEPAY